MDLFKNITVTDISQIVTINYPKGKTTNIENRNLYGLSFCTEGQIVYNINGKEVISDKNVVVLLPKHGTYTLYGTKGGIFPLINFQCDNFEIDTIISLPLNGLDEYISRYEKLKSLFIFNENRLKAYSVFYDILDRLSKEQNRKSNILSPAIKYIEKHLDDTELNNTRLAKVLNISEVYLRKLFLQNYGTTPKQHILNIRLEKAKQLLSQTTLPIKEIAYTCGFENEYYFSNFFKKHTHTSPSAFRNDSLS
jgi:AraC-like DNA-binding protein